MGGIPQAEACVTYSALTDSFPQPEGCDKDAALRLAEDEDEEEHVERDDGGGYEPGENGDPSAIYEFAHFGAVGGELYERNDGERKLEAENYLTEYQKAHHATFTHDGDHDYSGN